MMSKLVDDIINHYNSTYEGTKDFETYAMRRLDEGAGDIVVQPKFIDTAYCFDQMISLAISLKLSFYFGTRENECGILTPTLYIF